MTRGRLPVCLARERLRDEYAARLTYEGVGYADCSKYDILVPLRPAGDPAGA